MSELADRLAIVHEWIAKYGNKRHVAITSEAIAALRSEPVAWIPVGERLPKDLQDVAFIVGCPQDDYLHGRCLGGRFNANDWGGRFSVPGMSVEASHWMPLPAAPSRETDQRENSNPAPMHGQSKTGLTESHSGAPTHQRSGQMSGSDVAESHAPALSESGDGGVAPTHQSRTSDHPTAEPSLSVEQIEELRGALSHDADKWPSKRGVEYVNSLCDMALSSLTARPYFDDGERVTTYNRGVSEKGEAEALLREAREHIDNWLGRTGHKSTNDILGRIDAYLSRGQG